MRVASEKVTKLLPVITGEMGPVLLFNELLEDLCFKNPLRIDLFPLFSGNAGAVGEETGLIFLASAERLGGGDKLNTDELNSVGEELGVFGRNEKEELV